MAGNHGRETVRRHRDNEHYYVDGNTARRLNTTSDAVRPHNEEPVRYEKKPEIRYEKRKSALDLTYTVFVITAIAIALAICLLYIRFDARLMAQKQSVAALQTELQQIQEENNSLKETLNKTIDLNEIYRTATNKFGMIYADEDQVIFYNSSNSDYVRQYESIPGKR